MRSRGRLTSVIATALALSVALPAAATSDLHGPSLTQLRSDVKQTVAHRFSPGPLATTPRLDSLTADDSTIGPHRLGCWSNAVVKGISFNPSKECAYGDAHASTTVLLTGDSIAGMWLPTMDAIGKLRHWKVVFLGMRGCAPWGSPNDQNFRLYGSISARDCTHFSAQVQRWALTHHPKAIFLAGRAYPKGRNLDKTPAIGPFKVALGKTMRALRPSGARLYIFGPTPRYTYGTAAVEPKDCVTGTRAMSACSQSPMRVVPSTERSVEEYYDSVGKITMIKVQPLFCTTKHCPVVVIDHDITHLVFFDGVHINRYFAVWISRAINELIGTI